MFGCRIVDATLGLTSERAGAAQVEVDVVRSDFGPVRGAAGLGHWSHGFHPSAALVACHALVGCKSAWAAGVISCRALDPSCRVLLCALCTKSFILPTPYTLRATRRVSSRYEPHRRRAYLKYSMGDEARRVVEEGDGCRMGAMAHHCAFCTV